MKINVPHTGYKSIFSVWMCSHSYSTQPIFIFIIILMNAKKQSKAWASLHLPWFDILYIIHNSSLLSVIYHSIQCDPISALNTPLLLAYLSHLAWFIWSSLALNLRLTLFLHYFTFDLGFNLSFSHWSINVYLLFFQCFFCYLDIWCQYVLEPNTTEHLFLDF